VARVTATGDENVGTPDLGPVPTVAISDKAGSPAPLFRWDKLSPEERRSLSAQIAAEEASVQGLQPFSSPEQHRDIAMIFAQQGFLARGGTKTANGLTDDQPDRRPRGKRDQARVEGDKSAGDPRCKHRARRCNA
jgi:hypothetical protein